MSRPIEEVALIGKPASQGVFAPTIAGVVDELVRLYGLRDAMEVADARQNKWLEAEARCGKSDCEAIVPFESLKDTAHAHAATLEALLLQLEPRSADEALALLLMTDTRFQEWAADAYREHDPTPPEAEREWDAITRAIQVLVRWLVHRCGATSPLMASHGYERRLAPPPDQYAAALARARELAEAR